LNIDNNSNYCRFFLPEIRPLATIIHYVDHEPAPPFAAAKAELAQSIGSPPVHKGWSSRPAGMLALRQNY